MRAEIISIGTELLLGSILNRNAQFLSQKLAENAVDVYHQTTVGDNVGRIVECLERALGRADLVITSGGLGPTEDDVTVESVSKLLRRPLVFHRPTHKAILRRLRARKLAMTALVKRQCRVPKGSRVLANPNGTAPGLLMETTSQGRKNRLLLLPGPPQELQPIFQKALALVLKKAGAQKERFLIRAIRITGLIEAQVAQKVRDLLKMKPPVTVGIYAKPSEVELKIMAKSPSGKKALALAAVEKIIRKRFGEKIYGADSDTLSSVTGRLLRERGKTVAVAESCTGGLVSNLITQTPGSSDYFTGGVAAYDNRVKTRLLEIEERLLKKKGAASAEAAGKMAQGARRLFETDYGIGVTGIAGPGGGTPKKPVGLVFIAVAGRRRLSVRRYRFLGSRLDIQSKAAHEALDLLRLFLLRS